ncbi:MAG TPA: FlgO family outer membrane protein [Desulfohalobiaceae bacterium]|nr:FlgO family outer membrane protein [Desulfohalobiaceae bacterium]
MYKWSFFNFLWIPDQNKNKYLFISSLILFLLLGIGCQKKQNIVSNTEIQPFDLIQSSYAAGDILTMQLKKSPIINNNIVASASFVNIDNLSKSSTFGRTVSEQIASKLAQNGFRCIDLKLREKTIYIKAEKGEFVLSRKLTDISKKHNIKAFLVGTYSISARNIYVSTKIIHVKDSSIIASHDYSIRLTSQIYSMLPDSNHK